MEVGDWLISQTLRNNPKEKQMHLYLPTAFVFSLTVLLVFQY